MFISVHTVGLRRIAKISIGDGGDESFLRAIRMQANFSEYAPLTLVLLAFVDIQRFDCSARRP